MDNMVSSSSNNEARLMLSWLVDAGLDTLVAERPQSWLNHSIETPSKPKLETLAPNTELKKEKHNLNEASFASKPLPKKASETLSFGPMDATIGIVLERDPRAGRDEIIIAEETDLLRKMMQAIGQELDQVIRLGLFPDAVSPTKIYHSQRKILLLAGNTPSQIILGKPLAETRGRLHEIASSVHEDGTTDLPIHAISTFSPHALINQPSLKALAWSDLRLLLRHLKAL